MDDTTSQLAWLGFAKSFITFDFDFEPCEYLIRCSIKKKTISAPAWFRSLPEKHTKPMLTTINNTFERMCGQCIITCKDASKIYYVDNFQLHRECGPAKIEYFNHIDGDFIHEYYYQHNKLHREDGPATTFYNKNSNIICSKSYYLNGKIHRENGPAISTFDITGTRISEEYFRHGSLYRHNGVVAIYYKKDGSYSHSV